MAGPVCSCGELVSGWAPFPPRTLSLAFWGVEPAFHAGGPDHSQGLSQQSSGWLIPQAHHRTPFSSWHLRGMGLALGCVCPYTLGGRVGEDCLVMSLLAALLLRNRRPCPA